MDSVIVYIVEWINQYGYLAIFWGLALGVFGLPIPDEIGMTVTGFFIGTGQINLDIFLVYFSALIGSICGITLSYVLGYKFGYPLIRKYGYLIFLTEARLDRTEEFFRQWGGWVLPAGYFIPGVRHFTALITGMSKMPYNKFVKFAYLGAAFWCATFVGLGYFLGDRVIKVLSLAHDHKLEIALIITTFICIILVLWYWISSRKKKTI